MQTRFQVSVSFNMSPHVAVIGAGVVGLTTAVLMQEKIPGLQITLISEQFSPHTTGDGSAGLWKPHCLKDTPQSDILRWSSKTYSYMQKLWQDTDAGEIGVSLIPKYQLTEKPGGADKEQPEWTKVPVAYQILDRDQAQKMCYGNKSKITGGIHFISFTLEPARFLPYLTKKFKQRGGKIVKRKIDSLQDLFNQQFDVIVNCSGLQARNLVGDNLVRPVRGQVLRVKAPWLFHVVSQEKEDGSYIIPNEDSVILGGTLQEGNWNTKPDPADSISIHKGCCDLIPGLKEAVVVNEWAGLRPSRPKVRLEREIITDKYGNTLQVIHNYGHGGSGVTLSWGCAHEVVDILQDILYNQSTTTTRLSSKL
ncbi:hypothetical protein ANN_07190 [Periplaneta americana]|uniref:FAD dependent oxidoreductase domain-containing protein n=1 Tax=Periplaneta americana TaxID=6978 RepID=A0ABQ8THS1_PERAM|nr:hypothetical protein ANN_07190 [Periplaneta americana]